MAESQCKAVEINQRSFCIGSQPFLLTLRSIIFLTASVPLIVMPCVLGRFIPSCLSHYAHFTTCACTASGRPKMFCGGKVVAGLCLLFVLALCLASSPRNPRTLARARVVLTLISVVVMFI